MNENNKYYSSNPAYIKYIDQFRTMEDEDLLELYRQETLKQGWTSSRASYLAALSDVFYERGLEKPKWPGKE